MAKKGDFALKTRQMRRDGIERTRPNTAALIATAAVLLLASLSPAGVAAQPRALTAAEMDGVTAGGIRIDAVAFAQASGDFALAQTRSDAIVSTINAMELGIGFAEGLAFACCDPDSAVAVQSSVSTTGQIVHSSTYTTTFRGAIAGDDQVRHFTYGFTAAFLVAMSPGASPDAGEQAVRAPWEHLGDSIGELLGLGQTQSRGGVVSGYEFAPVFAAGVRWRLFKGLAGARPTGSIPQTGNLRASQATFP